MSDKKCCSEENIWILRDNFKLKSKHQQQEQQQQKDLKNPQKIKDIQRPNSASISILNTNYTKNSTKNVRFSLKNSIQSDNSLNKIRESFDTNKRMNKLNSRKTCLPINKTTSLQQTQILLKDHHHHSHNYCLSSSSSGVSSSASSTKSENISPKLDASHSLSSSSSCSSSSDTSNSATNHLLYSIVQKVVPSSSSSLVQTPTQLQSKLKCAPKAMLSDDGDIITTNNKHTTNRVSFCSNDKEKQREAVLEYIRNQTKTNEQIYSQVPKSNTINDVPIQQLQQQRLIQKNQSIKHKNNDSLAFLNKLHHKRHRFKSSTNDLSTSNASNTKANTLGQLSFYLTTRRLKGRNKFSLGICYLMLGPETKRSILPNQVTSLDTIKALFVRSFTDKLTMQYLDEENSVKIYIKDPYKDLFYQLDDINEIKDRCVLKLVELNSPLTYSNTQIASSTSTVYSQQPQQSQVQDKFYAYSTVTPPATTITRAQSEPRQHNTIECNIPSVETYDNINEHCIDTKITSIEQQQQQLNERSGSVTPKFNNILNESSLSLATSLNSFNTLIRDNNDTSEIDISLDQSDIGNFENSKMKIRLMQQQLQTLTNLVHQALATRTSSAVQQQQQQDATTIQQNDAFLNKNTIKLIDLNLKTKGLQNELQNLRKMHKNFNIQINESLKEFLIQINEQLKNLHLTTNKQNQEDANEQRVNNLLKKYEQESSKVENDLDDLEGVVDDLREQIMKHKCNVNINDVECYAIALSHLSKQLISLKTSFSQLKDELKSNKEFIYNETDRIDCFIRRCKRITGILIILKKLAVDKSKLNKEIKPLTKQLQLQQQQQQSVHLPRSLLNDIENIRPNHEQRQLAIEVDNAFNDLMSEISLITSDASNALLKNISFPIDNEASDDVSESQIKKRRNLKLQKLIQNEINRFNEENGTHEDNNRTYCTQFHLANTQSALLTNKNGSTYLETVEEEEPMDETQEPSKQVQTACFTTQKTICLDLNNSPKSNEFANYDNPYLDQQLPTNAKTMTDSFASNDSCDTVIEVKPQAASSNEALKSIYRNSDSIWLAKNDQKSKKSFLNFTRRNSMPSSLSKPPTQTCVSTKRISLNVTDL